MVHLYFLIVLMVHINVPLRGMSSGVHVINKGQRLIKDKFSESFALDKASASLYRIFILS